MVKILISACMLGCKVRYNASDLEVISSEFEKLITIHDVVSFCASDVFLGGFVCRVLCSSCSE